MHLDAPSALAKPSWDSPESISESNENFQAEDVT